MDKLLYILILFLTFLSSETMAECHFVSGYTKKTTTVTLPASLTIQKNTLSGSTVWDSGWILGGATRMVCSGANSMKTEYVNSQIPTGVAGDIYNTGIPGLGIRITFSNSKNTAYGAYVTSPGTVTSFNGSRGTEYTPESGYRVELIATDKDIESGTMTFSNPFAHLTYNNIVTNELVFSSVRINVLSLSCTVSTPNKVVAMGDISINRFSGIGSTPVKKDFFIDLACNSGTRINASLSGTQDSDSDTTVLSVSGAGGKGVAKGVGVKILYNETPLKLNQNVFLTTAASGNQSLNFQAVYIQTKSEVTAGKADSTATLNITYQ